MQAIEFVDRDGAPWAAPAKKLAQHCLRSGVLVLTAGTYDNVIRLLMPLVISDEQFHEALGVMERNLNAVAAENSAKWRSSRLGACRSILHFRPFSYSSCRFSFRVPAHVEIWLLKTDPE